MLLSLSFKLWNTFPLKSYFSKIPISYPQDEYSYLIPDLDCI